MTDRNQCRRCGSPLPAGGLARACPRCMLELGFESTSSEHETRAWSTEAGRESERSIAAPSSVIGRYRILRLIGEGGMGTVYEAEQAHPRRVVALKIVRAG